MREGVRGVKSTGPQERQGVCQIRARVESRKWRLKGDVPCHKGVSKVSDRDSISLESNRSGVFSGLDFSKGVEV